MVVCRYYQQGYCKFGNNCKFEHPSRGLGSQQSSNRFGALSSGGAGRQYDYAVDKYSLSSDQIEKDLTTEKPQWILSSYGPGRDTPDQLFGGYPREQSFEELRLHYIQGKASGNEQQALNQMQHLYRDALQQMQNAANNARQAAIFIAEGEHRHPNRFDVCRERTQGAPFGEFLVAKRSKPISPAPIQGNAFSSAAAATNPSSFGRGPQPGSAFGQPSALGQRPNPFGAPAFGQPAQPAPSAFGQASPFGQSTQAQAVPAMPGFGQLSALGTNANPFQAPVQSGLEPQTQNPFATGAGTAASQGPFASISNPNAMAATTTPTVTANPFAAAGSNQGNAAVNPFASGQAGQVANTPAAFGQTPASSNAFGLAPSNPTPNPFAAAANSGPTNNSTTNPFAQTSLPKANGAFGQAASGPFGQPSGIQPSRDVGNAQVQPSSMADVPGGGNPYPPGSNRKHPPLSEYSTKGMAGELITFKGRPVRYKNGVPGTLAPDGTWSRIWYANGPPAYNKDTELQPHEYDERTKAQWEAFANKGTFADGIMPELPPPRECTRWDF